MIESYVIVVFVSFIFDVSQLLHEFLFKLGFVYLAHKRVCNKFPLQSLLLAKNSTSSQLQALDIKVGHHKNKKYLKH